MTLNTRATQRRQMRALLRMHHKTLTTIAERYDTPPVFIEEAIKSINIAEANLRNCLDYAAFVTACNIAGQAVWIEFEYRLEMAKAKVNV